MKKGEQFKKAKENIIKWNMQEITFAFQGRGVTHKQTHQGHINTVQM